MLHKQFSNAKELLQLLIKEKPDLGNELYVRYGRTKDINEFVTNIERITQNNPKLGSDRAYAYLLRGNYDKGEDILFKQNWETHLPSVSILHMYVQLLSGNVEQSRKNIIQISIKTLQLV